MYICYFYSRQIEFLRHLPITTFTGAKVKHLCPKLILVCLPTLMTDLLFHLNNVFVSDLVFSFDPARAPARGVSIR